MNIAGIFVAFPSRWAVYDPGSTILGSRCGCCYRRILVEVVVEEQNTRC